MDLGTRKLLAEPDGAMKLGLAALNLPAALVHGVGEGIRRHAMDRNASSLASLFAAPDSVARIQAMAKAHDNPFLSDLLMRDALQGPAEMPAR